MFDLLDLSAKKCRVGSVMAVAALALSACSSGAPAQRFPAMPVTDVLSAASNPAFRSIDARSFEKAYVAYPLDDGFHRVPVGDYLAVKAAESFPRAAEVNNLRLRAYETRCETEGVFSDSVVCDVIVDMSFQLYKRSRRISYKLQDVDLGAQEEPDEVSYTVSDEPGADPFGRQLQDLIDVSLGPFRAKIISELAEANNRLVF